jgi:GH25 family lysozyme M1 (1,4-beta-N-acetylmuramidase)
MNFSNHGVVVPDTSFYQDDDSTPGKIDFAKMKAAGAKGVILRGGQNTWADEDFLDHYRAAKEAGLPRGSYWFYDSRNPPARQANIWHALIGNDLPELGLWTDLEESYNGQYRGEKYWKEFVLSVGAYFPQVKVQGIYTAYWWWNRQTVTDNAFWSTYPLWVAQYGVNQDAVLIPRPWVGKEPLFWQYTASGDGTKYGVESLEIDLNYFNGDADKFRSYFGLSDGASVPEEGNTMAKNKVTITYSGGARERQGPHATGNYGVILPPASVHYSDFDPIDDMDFPGDPDRKWIKLQSGWYVATRYPSSSGVTERCRVEAIPVAPAPADEITVSIEADIVATFNGKPYHGVVMFDNVQLRPVE